MNGGAIQCSNGNKFTGTCSGVNRSSSDGTLGDASDVCVVRWVFVDFPSESLHCSTSTSSSISAYRSTDNGPMD